MQADVVGAVRGAARPGLGRGVWTGILMLVLWAQLVFGVGMTLWRDSLILYQGWQAYPSLVPAEYDALIQLASDSAPPGSNVLYLSPGGDRYTARFARMHYFLYPRELVWLGLSPRTAPTDRWTFTGLDAGSLERAIEEQHVGCIVIDDVKQSVPVSGRRLNFDSSRYLILPSH